MNRLGVSCTARTAVATAAALKQVQGRAPPAALIQHTRRLGPAAVSTYSRALYSTDRDGQAPAQPARKFILPDTYASMVRRVFGRFLPRYQGPAIGQTVYGVCGGYPGFKEFWIDECQLPETFQTWFSTTSLYVWMAMVRIRADPNAKHYNQGLVDSFFRDTEKKIRATGIKSGRIVNDTLKDLVSSFKGTVMSLDEGLARSDAVLAAAVWRNLLPVDDAVLQTDLVVRHIRAQIAMLDACDIGQITTGQFSFGPVAEPKTHDATTSV
ncbi:Ubiquinol cytochrome-c reductase assembly protein Cbp3 [Coemansia sp. RSA 552]|nr:Ubiquinol cytochrome-c reductase assembly protein Cbp3 [Coemansia sp. RSA 552]